VSPHSGEQSDGRPQTEPTVVPISSVVAGAMSEGVVDALSSEYRTRISAASRRGASGLFDEVGYRPLQ
jgi:hypothetical protein